MKSELHNPTGPKERVRFEPPRYVLSDNVRHALAESAKAYKEFTFDKNCQGLDKETAQDLARDFHEALSLDETGQEALRALDQLYSLSGSPAIILGNLPQDDEQIMKTVLAMYQHYTYGEAHIEEDTQLRAVDETLGDKPVENAGGQIDYMDPAGYLHPHSDNEDTAALFCVRQGKYKRPTELYSLSDWVDVLLDHLQHPPTNERERWEMRERAIQVLGQPLWNPRTPKNSGVQHYYHSQGIGMNSQDAVPLLYLNTNYDPAIAGSLPYCAMNFGFSGTPDLTPEFKGQNLAAELSVAWGEIKRIGNIKARSSVYLKEGEMLVLNNHGILHAGGQYAAEEKPREGEDMAKEDCRFLLAADGEMKSVEHHPTTQVSWAALLEGKDPDKPVLASMVR